MNKQEFLESLRRKLAKLPQKELEERLSFYAEMIDDRIEEGLTEEEAVAAIGTVDNVVSQIASDIPLSTIVKERLTTKEKISGDKIALLVLSFPLWLSLLLAAFGVAISLYASLWAVVASLWAAFLALAVCAPASIILSIIFAFSAEALPVFATIAAAFICAGLAIFLYFGCVAATKGALKLAKKCILSFKKSLIKKEDVQ